MQQHRHENDQNLSNSNSNVVTRHLFLLILMITIGIVVYVLTQNPSVVTASIIGLILVHVIAAGVLVMFGPKLFARAIRKFHGVPDNPPQTDAHNHSHDLETGGETINWANAYDVFTRFVLMGQYQKMIQSTVEIANIHAGETVLDVGCGTGTLAIAAKKANHPSVVIHALDASTEMIARAQQKARNEGVPVEFTPGLIENIDAPDDSYDLVMNSLMMHHLPEELKVKAFAEIYRVLKPGGRLLIVDFEPPQDRLTRIWLSLTPVKVMLQIDNSSIPPQLENAGFENIEIGATDSAIASYITARKA